MQITKIQQLGIISPHKVIKEDMLELIRKNIWQEGEKIPTEDCLSKKYNVSRITIRKALKQLEDDNILQVKKGSGRIVVKVPCVEKKSKTIGVICNKYGTSYGEVEYLKILAEKSGYNLHVYLFDDVIFTSSLDMQLQHIMKEDIIGIIVLCRNVLKEQILKLKQFFPIVAIYQDLSDSAIPSFAINWRFLSYEASQYFFKNGYDKQLILLNEFSFFKDVNMMIIEGFDYAYHKNNCKIKDNQIILLPNERHPDKSEYMQKVYNFINKNQNKCAVFSYWTWPILEILNFAIQQNIEIPNNLSIICANDSERMKNAILPVSVFEFDRNKLVRNAFEQLKNQIISNSLNDCNTNLNFIYGKLKNRNTTNAI